MVFTRIAAILALVFAGFSVTSAIGQTNGNGVTIQLPSVNQFSVRGPVMVPDGGSMHLGGLSTSAFGRTSRGVPGLSSIPYLNRLFRNEAIGRESSARNARVFVQIISLKEIEEGVLAEAERRRAFSSSAAKDPNGTPNVQRKADFISRNIGRSKKR